jgi:hypothetical protein
MKRNTLRFAQLEASSIAPTVWPILGGYTHLLKDFIQWIRCRSPSFLLGIGQPRRRYIRTAFAVLPSLSRSSTSSAAKSMA